MASRIIEASNTRAILAVPYEPLRDAQWAAIVTLVDADRPAARGGKPVDRRSAVNRI